MAATVMPGVVILVIGTLINDTFVSVFLFTFGTALIGAAAFRIHDVAVDVEKVAIAFDGEYHAFAALRRSSARSSAALAITFAVVSPSSATLGRDLGLGRRLGGLRARDVDLETLSRRCPRAPWRASRRPLHRGRPGRNRRAPRSRPRRPSCRHAPRSARRRRPCPCAAARP